MAIQKTIGSLLFCSFIAFSMAGIGRGLDAQAQSINVSSDTAASKAAQVNFVHPGILNTKSGLDHIAADIASGNTTRLAAYKRVTDFIETAHYPTSFPSTIYVGSNGHTSPSKNQIRANAELAYAYALKFAATADTAAANKCIYILNGWAYNFKNYTTIDSTDNPNQPCLETSWTTPSFVAAAEIIRHYKPKGVTASWSKKDIQQFCTYLRLVKNNYMDKIPNYKNNWNVSAGYAKIAIGVFLDDQAIYDDGKKVLNTVLPQAIKEDGTMPELCVRKDCVHFQYSLTGLTYAAEIAHISGDNSIYNALDGRISKGYQFLDKAFAHTAGCDVCGKRSELFPGIEVALMHYGWTQIEQLRDKQGPLGLPRDYTFLGFTTYTHYKLK